MRGYNFQTNTYYLSGSESYAMGAVIHKPGATVDEIMELTDNRFAKATIQRTLRDLAAFHHVRKEFRKVEGKPYSANHYFPRKGGPRYLGVTMPKKDWQRRPRRYWFAIVNKHGSIVKTLKVQSILESDMLEEAKRKDKSYPKCAPHYAIRITESGTPVPEEAAE